MPMDRDGLRLDLDLSATVYTASVNELTYEDLHIACCLDGRLRVDICWIVWWL